MQRKKGIKASNTGLKSNFPHPLIKRKKIFDEKMQSKYPKDELSTLQINNQCLD